MCPSGRSAETLATCASGRPRRSKRMLWHFSDTCCHNSERKLPQQVLFLEAETPQSGEKNADRHEHDGLRAYQGLRLSAGHLRNRPARRCCAAAEVCAVTE